MALFIELNFFFFSSRFGSMGFAFVLSAGSEDGERNWSGLQRSDSFVGE